MCVFFVFILLSVCWALWFCSFLPCIMLGYYFCSNCFSLFFLNSFSYSSNFYNIIFSAFPTVLQAPLPLLLIFLWFSFILNLFWACCVQGAIESIYIEFLILDIFKLLRNSHCYLFKITSDTSSWFSSFIIFSHCFLYYLEL